LSFQEIPSTIKTNNLLSSLSLGYKILEGLDISCNFGYTNMQTDESLLYPAPSRPPENRATSNSSSNFGHNNINSWLIEPQATYKWSFSKAQIQAIGGGTINQLNSFGQQISGYGY